jgi:hypothetical protein
MSAAFVKEVGREITRKKYSETLDADDERIVSLSTACGFAINLNGPVIGDPVVTVDGTAIPKRTSLTGTGWVLIDRYRLELVSYDFGFGVGSISLVYEAGESVPLEPVTVPASPYQVQASQGTGPYLSDISVSYVSSGNALAKVASSPALAQYAVNATGTYTFAAADTGAALYLSYAYLPGDVEECVIEMVAYTFRKRERLDHNSSVIGGQSIFLSREAWPVTVQQVIDRWRRPTA